MILFSISGFIPITYVIDFSLFCASQWKHATWFSFKLYKIPLLSSQFFSLDFYPLSIPSVTIKYVAFLLLWYSSSLLIHASTQWALNLKVSETNNASSWRKRKVTPKCKLRPNPTIFNLGLLQIFHNIP